MSLKDLKAFFYEEDEKKPAPPAQEVHSSAPVISNQPSTPTVSPAEIQEVDKKLHEILMESLRVAGIASYTALDDMLDSLADIAPDLNVRYKKALEILAKQGHSLPLIYQDIEKAVGALEEASRNFEADQKKQFQESVGALHTSVDKLSQQIAAKQAQQAALTQEIAMLTKSRDTSTAEIASEQAQIDKVEGRFVIVYKSFMDEVQGQKSEIEKRMKP